ncbi:MAG TPA: DUF6703 family protein [Jiangellales bacterium]|nr:DUF6703 family protein [Jiangellales bacterium]
MSRNRRRSGRPGRSRDPRRPTAPPPARQRGPRPGQPRSAPAAPAPGARAALERVSYPVLARIAAAPRWLVGLVAGAVLLGGLLAPRPFDSALLLVVAAFLGWLLVLSWPAVDGRGRVIRLAALGAVLVAVAVSWAGG